MRKFLFLIFLVPVMAYSQAISVNIPYLGDSKSDYFYRVVDTTGGTPRVGAIIQGRTFSSGVTDTTQALETTKSKSLWLHIAVKDSISMYVKYQLSLDGVSFGPLTQLDSVKNAAPPYFVKSYNVSAPADSARFIRFVLATSILAYPLGTTTPTYSASYAIKRY